MKQFNLEEYLANPSRKVVTGDGRNVRIICTDSKIRNYPIIALVEEPSRFENLFTYTEGGQMVSYEPLKKYDLFFTTERKEGWANLYRGNIDYIGGCVYTSKEEAEENIGNNETYVATTKIEREE